MTMVPATTAKLTGSTAGPEVVQNAIRPMPPAAISRRHSAGMSLVTTGGPARRPYPGGAWAPAPSRAAGVVCRAAASRRSAGGVGPSRVSLHVFQVAQAHPGPGGYLCLAQVEFGAPPCDPLAQVTRIGWRRPRPFTPP